MIRHPRAREVTAEAFCEAGACRDATSLDADIGGHVGAPREASTSDGAVMTEAGGGELDGSTMADAPVNAPDGDAIGSSRLGIVVVRHDRQGTRVLRECRLAGAYRYADLPTRSGTQD